MENNEIFSKVVGYTSIACWIVVLYPQIWTNYKRKSSESISMTFIWLWAIGDLLNLSGAILQNLLTTMIILAVYYVLTDVVLILQVTYYRKHSDEIVYNSIDETTPLMPNNDSIPESRRQARNIQFLVIFFSLTGICFIVGITYFAYFTNEPQEVIHSPLSLWTLYKSEQEMKLLPQIFGWASAILYLGARIPQIIQNYRSKSTEGLSLAMFCFSVLGNLTYSLSILLHSTDPKFLLINLPWLVGSVGTIIFDFCIFAQFYIYKQQ